MQTVGRYQVLDKLGQGGMGAVYKAYDPLIERVVAVKVISAQLDLQPEWRDRFFREARAAGQLSHPNIITIYDLGEQDGQPYLAMEFLEGRDLDRRMRGSDNMTVSRKLEIAMSVCEGLAHAHQMGIVHRDVKPANVFITDTGHVKILDFGLARVVSSDLTHSHVMLGTMNYMAPEQIRGEKIDHRADIFAVGVLCYELLGGRKAFHSDSFAATMYQILQAEPEPVERLNPHLPPQLSPIIARAMAKSREDRYQHMTDLLHDLDLVYEQLRGGVGKAANRIDAGAHPGSRQSSDSSRLEHDISNAPTMAGVLTPSLDAPPHFNPRPGSGSGPRSDVGSAPPLAAFDPAQAPPPRGRSRVLAAGIAVIGLIAVVAAIWFLQRARSVPEPPQVTQAIPPAPSGAPKTAPQGDEAVAREPEPPPVQTVPPPQASEPPAAKTPPAAPPDRSRTATPPASESREALRAAAEAFETVAAARSAALVQRAPELAPDAWASASREEARARGRYDSRQYAAATAQLYAAAGLFRTAEGLARAAATAAAEAERRESERQAAEKREADKREAEKRAQAAEPPPQAAPPPAAPAEPVAPPTRAEPVPATRSPGPGAPGPTGPPPEEAVLAGVRRYVAALEGRNMTALKSIWPGLGGAQQAAIQSDFANARRIDAEFSSPKVRVDGSTATVIGRRRYAVQTRDGHQLETATTTTITFRNVAGVWQIDSMQHQAVR